MSLSFQNAKKSVESRNSEKDALVELCMEEKSVIDENSHMKSANGIASEECSRQGDKECLTQSEVIPASDFLDSNTSFLSKNNTQLKEIGVNGYHDLNKKDECFTLEHDMSENTIVTNHVSKDLNDDDGILFSSMAEQDSDEKIVSTPRGLGILGKSKDEKFVNKGAEEAKNGLISNILKLERKGALNPKNLAKNRFFGSKSKPEAHLETDTLISGEVGDKNDVDNETKFLEDVINSNNSEVSMDSNKVRRRFFGNKPKQNSAQVENDASLPEEFPDAAKNLQIRLPRGIKLSRDGQQNDRIPAKELVAEKMQYMKRRIDSHQHDRTPAKELVAEKIQNMRRRIDNQQHDRTHAKEIVAEKIQNIRRRIHLGKGKGDKDKEHGTTFLDNVNEWDWPDQSGEESEDDTALDSLFEPKHPEENNFFESSRNERKDGIHRSQTGKEKEASSRTTHGITSLTKDSIFWHHSTKEKVIRVKPYHRFSPSKVYMTHEEILENMLQPSFKMKHLQSNVKQWFNVKNENLSDSERLHWAGGRDGRIGSLRVEVLRCVGLKQQRPDISVYLVCGDTAFATDMINGSRSPIWPASSKRAVCFPLFHAYAKLSVGVFDIKKKNENDVFCGRTTVDIASLRPDTEYDVTLPLRSSVFVYDRRPRGVIRIRCSLHWFSERAAVLSYLKSPRISNKVAHSEQPSILCADPKTFRNVALTVHGKQLPGKYSREAFRATMREFNLYQMNLAFLSKSSLRVAVFYEKPLLSIYIFGAWMHSVYKSSVRLVPVYSIGLLIYLLIESYFWYGRNRITNLGYSRLSLQEILLALLQPSNSQKMHTLTRETETKSDFACTNDSSEVIHHREFPFSNGEVYKTFNAEESVYRKNGNHWRDKKDEIQEKLSISLRHETQDEGSIEGERDFESDTETEIMDDNDNVCGLHADENLYVNDDSHHRFAWSSALSQRSSVIVGPPQSNDDKPQQQIPPQIHLARLERNLNNLTFSISMDKLLASSLAYRPGNNDNDDQFKSVLGKMNENKRGKRVPLDEFDKRLGYRVRHPNPLTEITTSFMGPLMRIFRIFCVVVRTGFNIGVWTDPYLSFWTLLFLILLMILLIVFPWRLFFLILGFVGFGPQNMFLQDWLKRRTTKQTSEEESDLNAPDTLKSSDPKTRDEIDLNSSHNDKKGNLRRLKNSLAHLKENRQKRVMERNEAKENRGDTSRNHSSSEDSTDISTKDSSIANEKVRAFSATISGSRKNMAPREVLVPYSRVRMERFFDWPPDPTVSRAAPIQFENYQRGRMTSAASLENESVIYFKDDDCEGSL